MKKRNLERNGAGRKKKETSLLEGLPENLPSLCLAYRLTQRASAVGFDWSNVKDILTKFEEEMKEFREALSFKKRKKIEEEIGDLLFVLVNIARFLKVDPEAALRRTIEKFTTRFNYMEKAFGKEGRTLWESDLSEMDRLWEEAKKKHKGHER